jgi:hypothetical protein
VIVKDFVMFRELVEFEPVGRHPKSRVRVHGVPVIGLPALEPSPSRNTPVVGELETEAQA